MSLIKWSVGLIVFQILILILLTGVGDYYQDDVTIESNVHALNESVSEDAGFFGTIWNVGSGMMSVFTSITYSVANMPWWANTLMLLPGLIGVILILAFIRGVN